MSTCRFVASDQPRVVKGRHRDECADRWTDDLLGCQGCQPCPEPHCRVCQYAHVDGTCAECLTETREALRGIGRMCGALPAEVATRGVEGEAMVLLGPTADPEAWGHVSASYLAGRLPEGWFEANHGKGCPTLVNEPCTGCGGSERHPNVVLLGWQMVYRDALEHSEPADAELATAIGYLDMNLGYMAGYADVPFEDFAKDIRGCAGHLEAVLHDGEQIDRGAPCMTCRHELRRIWKGDRLPWSSDEHPEKAREDGWVCTRCRRWHNDQQYRLAVAQLHNAAAEWLTDRDMEQRTGVKAGTVRVWALRGEVARRRDSGRTLYAVAEVMTRAGLAS